MKISRPNRITRSYTQSLVAPPEKVMPLLCPVMEAEWIDGWDPVLVLSDSGVVEPGVCLLPMQNRTMPSGL